MAMIVNALNPGSSLLALVEPGLNAMRTADRALIAPVDKPKIGDSLDLDAASVQEFPQDCRWDYILSVPSKNKLIGIEPHSASDGEIKVVIRKKRNALVYLRNHLRPMHAVVEWHWVTRGKTGFSKMDRATRALDQHGITFGGRRLKSL